MKKKEEEENLLKCHECKHKFSHGDCGESPCPTSCPKCEAYCCPKCGRCI